MCLIYSKRSIISFVDQFRKKKIIFAESND